MDYEAFISERMKYAPSVGFEDADIVVRDHLFPHQSALTRWALRIGRAAIFADTGLGKTAMQLEWARNVSMHGRVLILTPLAVAAQTIAEAKRWGVDAVYAREDSGQPIIVTNYEHVEKFDPREFVGVVLDESSILKNYTGAFRNMLIEAFIDTPYRLACTATPAPNDHMELGNHSEFLGVKSRVEMLSEYFVHDGGKTTEWRLKGHAEEPFWEWVASWAAVVRLPSDLGFDDNGYILPPCRMHEKTIGVDHREAWSAGFLFAPEATTLNDQRAIRRATVEHRAELCSEIARGDDPCLIWCELNDEADAVCASIPGAVQVQGSDSIDDKIDRLIGFAEGRYRVLVTKPKIAGFGMNWQHCSKVVFAGASHSYEQTYQAIRRCWRFGQTKPVDVYIVTTEQEVGVLENYRKKEAAAERMRSMMLSHMRELTRRNVGAGHVPRWNAYDPKVPMEVPKWLSTQQI